MASGDCFITIDQIPGESEDSAFPDAIQVSAWNWGVKMADSTGRGHAEARASGRADVRMFEFAHQVDAASAGLLMRCVQNAPVRKAVLVIRRAGGSAQKYLHITLQSVRIASVDIVHDTDHLVPVERVRLAFEEVTFEYVPQGKAGNDRTGRKTFSWRMAEGS